MAVADVMKKIKQEKIKFVDLRFTDMPGTTHHITIPIKFLNEDLFQATFFCKAI